MTLVEVTLAWHATELCAMQHLCRTHGNKSLSMFSRYNIVMTPPSGLSMYRNLGLYLQLWC